ncbi:PQ loop repeat domain-containing protein [Hirsutella rhossiliensis]|uniref:PQ loop repeat domain-containing protein n=1 Tax=Hirsutella rhossiliensis TaxID=111463 RepID=A0A9P8N6N8_9HYPO|nr:PQ loop repeat domain-containing protein [Hirsutella rhossiliensis]KAH0967967.1 PQ loop repeat domain-containing protein [Hirsutella rhossiliensis]
MDVPVAANALGALGAVCWSVQLIPQIVINHRRHHATGLQPSMMMLWACAGVPLGVYNIVQDFNLALCIQPQILTLLSLMTWMQCRHYQRGWTAARSLLAAAPIAVVMGSIQAALIIGLRLLKYRHHEWPLTLMAVLSAVLLAAGVVRHYWDIWVHRTVRGISFIFVGIDAAGDLFSLVSVVFQPKLHVLGMAIYGSELLLWLGILACGGYYNALPWIQKQLQHSDPTSAHGMPPFHAESAAGPVSLRDLPSSSSVFRTVSAGSDFLRPRAMTSMGRSRDGLGDIS